ncbi:pentatricopeptide repeat-containing protein At5g43790-like [Coffea eugenioides]|uniref:pentatricopeptide repeat-containing protein At5g43790-like n=1 Tax=Coffea eugenioides TaxID=49369 RepID=UPI000F605628|nr:pentatricopeptide repeat-containing protein At5g43790-like [Coffea eugenioides]
MNTPLKNHPILQLLYGCKTLNSLWQIHAQMITTGLILHTYPLSRIILVSSSITTNISYAETIFNQVKNPTIFLYNILISCYTTKGKTHDALSLYNRIFSNNMTSSAKPNNYTYPSLFKACGAQLWFQHGKALHAHVLKFLEPPYDQFVQASLLNFYSSCGKIGIARYLFDQTIQPDLAVWNSILSAYATNCSVNFDANADSFCDSTGLWLEVLHLFSEMQKCSIQPNEVTLVALISACADLGALSQGMWAHGYVVRKKLGLNIYLGSALINMYSNCGCLKLAYQLFDELPERDTFCYNAMIRGLAVHGHGREALELFEKMALEGLVPDDVTLLVVMFACSHLGLVDQGCKYFYAMHRDYGIAPKLEHYGCLVDILGRAGRVAEAEETIHAMPMKPTAVLWRSLLGAARVHGNIQVGKVALKYLIQLEPETSGNYVLLSNIYASMNRWDDVKNVRKLMKEFGINKMPGTSILEIDGEMHEFSSGDKTHPKAKEIYLKLDDMNGRLKEHGYKPRTREVLFDIEEEEKEDHLSYHSERLAIAFALMECRSDSPIRIIKNLRVCGDCHDIAKLISRIYGRELIVRDRSRFHHFREGTCSCLDYW